MSRIEITTLLTTLCLAGCGGASDAPLEPEETVTGLEGEPSDTSGSSSTTSDSDEAFYDCEESDFEVILPLTGPGVGPDGQLLELEQDRYVLHTTQMVARPEASQEALALSIAVIGALNEIPGFVAVSASRSEACGYLRTLGIWESEQAMYQLLATPEHVVAMERTLELSFTGKTTHWEATAEETRAFDWETTRRKLAEVEPSPVYQ